MNTTTMLPALLLLAACSGGPTFSVGDPAPDAGDDSAARADAPETAEKLARDSGVDVAEVADAAPDVASRDTGADVACVPLTQAQACAGKTCGLVSDGCEGSFSCMTEAGVCPFGQGCGIVEPNVCGGCVPAEAGTIGCGNAGKPFVDCPLTDAGTPYLAPGCIYNAGRELVCCS